jgi:glycosyltransferase involved in cell wall biosynthesis
MKAVALYLECKKEQGGTFQYARTVLHALSAHENREYRLVAISPPGTEWGPICRGFGVEWVEIGSLGLTDRVMGKLLRMTGSHSPALRRAMSRVTPLGRALNSLGANLAIYTEYEHFSYELATSSLIPIHDLMHRYESRFSENLAFEGADEFFAKICNGARGVLVDSEVGREQLIESYGPFSAEVFVLPYIPADYVYDESILDPDPEIDATMAALPEKLLFYPAQFWEHKNHNRLIDAVMQLAEKYPDIHLVLAGSKKNFYDAVIAHIDELGAGDRVTLLGYVSDAAKLELYRRARALVMPSFYGPTNIPQLEAFVLGCPVATSRIYGIPAQVGDAALLFDPSSVDEIRDAVEQLWSDDELCASLVERGYARAAQWGPAQFAQVLSQIVDSCLEEGR